MTRRGIAAVVAATALAGVASWAVIGGVLGASPAPPPVAASTSEATNIAAPADSAATDGAPQGPGAAVEDVSAPGSARSQGETPMAARVATIGLLNKRNGQSRELVMKPGDGVRVGDAIVRLRACEQTAPWEQDQLTGAFVQLDVQGVDRKWRRAFSGWVFKERPALNVVQNPIYDIWPKSCTMRFPAAGPDTVTAASQAASAVSSASRARKSPVTSDEPTESPAKVVPSAEDNATR